MTDTQSKTFAVGATVWFITPQSRKIYSGAVVGIAETGCYDIQSGGYEKMLFPEELFATREEAERTLNEGRTA